MIRKLFALICRLIRDHFTLSAIISPFQKFHHVRSFCGHVSHVRDFVHFLQGLGLVGEKYKLARTITISFETASVKNFCGEISKSLRN